MLFAPKVVITSRGVLLKALFRGNILWSNLDGLFRFSGFLSECVDVPVKVISYKCVEDVRQKKFCLD